MSRKRRQIELDYSFVEGIPPGGVSGLPPGYSGPLPPPGNARQGDWFKGLDTRSKDGRQQVELFHKAPYAMKGADDAARNEYLASLSKAAQHIDADARAIRKSMGGHASPPIQMIRSDISARHVLIERKVIDLKRQRVAANSYFGSSPFGKSPIDYAVATHRLIKKSGLKPAALTQALRGAYGAAYTVLLREAEIKILHGQIATLQKAVANAEAQAEAQRKAHAEAMARTHAEAMARAQAEAKARVQAAAMARVQAEAQARARAQAEAVAREKAAAEAALAEQKTRAAHTYKIPLTGQAAMPAYVSVAGAPALVDVGNALAQGIRAAAAAVAAVSAARVVSVEGLAAPILVGVAALLYSPKLGNGELQSNYLLSAPLADLALELDASAQAAAIERGSVEVPVRLGDRREADGPTELLAIRSNADAIPSTVRVLAARHHAESGHYSVTTEHVPPRTLVWTPIVTPPDSSTTSPATPPSVTTMVGPRLEPVEGRVDTFPDLPDVGFDDYVIIFPADSGLPPLYVMFMSPRQMPGVVVGEGAPEQASLLVEGNERGAPIPASIADELRGMHFSSFDAFRRQLWKSIAKSNTLLDQFDEGSLFMMRRGLAPVAPASEQVGGRIKYEIHHIVKIVDGGKVYDLDNMVFLSPKFHIKIHSGR